MRIGGRNFGKYTVRSSAPLPTRTYRAKYSPDASRCWYCGKKATARIERLLLVEGQYTKRILGYCGTC